MIISDIRTHLLSVPFAVPPKTGFLDLKNIELLVVEIETVSGVIGTGHLHPLAGGLRTLEMCISDMLSPLLIGEGAGNVETLWKKNVACHLYSRPDGYHRHGNVCTRYCALGYS